jgi:hypothetical protein
VALYGYRIDSLIIKNNYMFTPTILGKSLSKEDKSVRVTVQFTEGAVSFQEDLKFGLDFTEAEMKRRIKRIVDDLEAVKTKVDSLALGVVDLTGVVLNTEIQAEVDERQWFRKVNRLRAFQELKTLGGMPVAWQADLDALIASVQTDARKAYLNNL